jgi:hypothetical protein
VEVIDGMQLNPIGNLRALTEAKGAKLSISNSRQWATTLISRIWASAISANFVIPTEGRNLLFASVTVEQWQAPGEASEKNPGFSLQR